MPLGNYRNVEYILEPDLDASERLLWSGIPKQGLSLQKADLFMIPFSLLWGGFAIFWEYTVLKMDAPLVMALFGVPFVLLGLYLIFGRFFYEAQRRKKTYYGLTNERIIIKSGVMSSSIKSLALQNLTDITLNEGVGAMGSIVFGTEKKSSSMLRGTGWLGSNAMQTPAFEQIQEVRSVYKKIIEAQKKLL